ncbi:SRPBCC family protein [Mycobacteroides immunogenum]|uniref:Immediate-early protein 2 n=1 Tax=Mycobacteroides immunogenum TaxID=83262 RepID=A0A7V8LSA0_9MYCO|nr:SRPBCC family protein [Mycobacteroides immunogenum]AMT71545.1 Immediate-early protein 2 [Mycobacteroides immunogenum]ANO04663.1 Immediate-early protein 2 [Mycobacteroides immunogenum]KIU42271.1 Immediate-early protein 2 [Mycobacteroides immunogenum]KPG15150.1 Immediate-early protein 2 [Mycobacteroides immunogenum]KPG15765.1 Immediate-early protein 2 [Mycobacteroides immunogenum]
MALLRIERRSALPADAAFTRITDWPRHSEHIPLTTVVVTSEPPAGVGTTFVGRTRLGRIGFEDPMTVTRWEPPRDGRPGRCRLQKTGTLVLGWAEIEVHAEGAGSRVIWTEDVSVRGVPRIFDPLAKAGGQWMFGRALTGLLR